MSSQSWISRAPAMALAWLLAQGQDIVPIPGTRQSARLDENIGALEVRLSEDELASIDRIFPPEAVAGARYAPAGMATIGR